MNRLDFFKCKEKQKQKKNEKRKTNTQDNCFFFFFCKIYKEEMKYLLFKIFDFCGVCNKKARPLDILIFFQNI